MMFETNCGIVLCTGISRQCNCLLATVFWIVYHLQTWEDFQVCTETCHASTLSLRLVNKLLMTGKLYKGSTMKNHAKPFHRVPRRLPDDICVPNCQKTTLWRVTKITHKLTMSMNVHTVRRGHLQST